MKCGFRQGATTMLALLYLLAATQTSCQKENDLPGQIVTPGSGSPAAGEITMTLRAVTQKINNRIGGYYVGLPSNYQQTSQTFPLLVYMHGAGQIGNGTSDLPQLLKDGTGKLLHENKFPATITVEGATHSFIVIMPQVNSFPGASDVNATIAMARKAWRIDPSRIYVSGLSAGSMASCDFAAEAPGQVAALVAMAGVSSDYAVTDKCQKIVSGNVPLWAFHSVDDPQVNVVVTKGYVDKINSLHPRVTPRLTLWPNGGHDAWTRALDPGYRENGMNIYQWMLQFKR